VDHGEAEAVFQMIAAALGYKQNKLPFTLLAQRAPLQLLRENATTADSLLFGVAGFLAADIGDFNAETRDYVRRLWDGWWSARDRMSRLVVPAELWKLGGARPANHPQRRVGALSAIASSWSKFFNSLGNVDDQSAQFLAKLHHSFWDHHYTVSAAPMPAPMALIGKTRIAEIEANVILPCQLSRGQNVWARYVTLRAELTNRKIETAATRLFGDDARRATLLRQLVHQQGLLQIYEDFCMQDNSDCIHCPFPEQMQKWPNDTNVPRS
jgi:hypothetical protein